MSEQPIVTIYLDSGKEIGEVSGTTFRKVIEGSKHFLRRPPAIAFDVVTIQEAEKLGAKDIMVVDKETKKKYRTTIFNLWHFGFMFNRGKGDQIALRMPYWKTI